MRESDHTITLKNGKIIGKSDLAIKRLSALKKASPRKRDQLMKCNATKGPRKIIKPQRNVGFRSSKATQKKRNLQAKFEELDIARRNSENEQLKRDAPERGRTAKTVEVTHWPRNSS